MTEKESPIDNSCVNLKRGLSIDIGVHNMAFYVEEFDATSLGKLKCPKAHRYNDNHEPTKLWNDVLKKVYKNGKTIFHDKCNLSDEKGVGFDLSLFINLSNYLEYKRKNFDDVDFIVIERQLKENPMAQRIEQHCISWFTFQYIDTKPIIVFNASNKTKVLGAPKKLENKKGTMKAMSKAQRKKWACDEAAKIFGVRDDIEGMHFVFSKNSSKKDDLSDVMVQLNAFKVKCFIDNELN